MCNAFQMAIMCVATFCLPGQRCMAPGLEDSPDGLQAALQGLGGNVAAPHPVDLVGEAEADLQPVVNVESHHAGRAEAGRETISRRLNTRGRRTGDWRMLWIRLLRAPHLSYASFRSCASLHLGRICRKGDWGPPSAAGRKAGGGVMWTAV